jgi:xanthine dehydrogenase accessory factor
MKRATLQQIQADRAAKRPVVLATNLASGEEQLLYPTEPAVSSVASNLATKAAAALRSDRSATVVIDGTTLFLHAYNPPLRMIIVGAVHIAQPLARMATLADYDVTIVDPRRSFATDERFPGLEMAHDWPDEALERLKPDHRTAVVTLTHDPKLDDPALEVVLRSSAFYIGALGSKRTHAARIERLRLQDVAELDLGRIHGPVGLAIGAKSPAEVAIAIMAEATERLRAEPVLE